MKAVIVDLLHEQAAALCDDGRVVKLADAGYTLGQIVEVHEQRHRRPRWTRVFASVAAAAVLLMGVGGAAYAVPYGVVTLEADSSVQYTINCFDYVLDVQAANEEGEALLAGMDARQLRHRPVERAIAATMEHIERDEPSRRTEESYRISAETRNDRHSERLRQELEPLIARDPPPPPQAESAPPEEQGSGDREAQGAGRMPDQDVQGPEAPEPGEMIQQEGNNAPASPPDAGEGPRDRSGEPGDPGQRPLPPTGADDSSGGGQASPPEMGPMPDANQEPPPRG